MARIKLELPEIYIFSTELKLRITDLNYGGHLGNDALLSLLHEARVQFLQHFGWSELDLAGAGLILSDVGIEYKAEGFYGDTLQFQVTPFDLHKYGFDLAYRVTNQHGREVARAKTGMLCFNYKERKLMALPEQVRTEFETKTA